jgi:hypothetical protein
VSHCRMCAMPKDVGHWPKRRGRPCPCLPAVLGASYCRCLCLELTPA